MCMYSKTAVDFSLTVLQIVVKPLSLDKEHTYKVVHFCPPNVRNQAAISCSLSVSSAGLSTEK
uniref:Uncharacterized protein n=1 Tax=Anguilla anguilla TaxID=7936 RepID=A0A0E9WZ44_ANGAN